MMEIFDYLMYESIIKYGNLLQLLNVQNELFSHKTLQE